MISDDQRNGWKQTAGALIELMDTGKFDTISERVWRRALDSILLLVEEDERLQQEVEAVNERGYETALELERTRNLCVAFESHIADSSLARFRHENVDRFIPEPGYPNGEDSEIDVASPWNPNGVPQQ